MKPKKVIVLTGFTEHRTGLLRLVLRVHGREVCVCERPGDAIRRAKRGRVDLLLSGSNEHVGKIKAACWWVPTILLAPHAENLDTLANIVLPMPTLDMCELIEAIRILLVRKRGPIPKELRRVA